MKREPSPHRRSLLTRHFELAAAVLAPEVSLIGYRGRQWSLYIERKPFGNRRRGGLDGPDEECARHIQRCTAHSYIAPSVARASTASAWCIQRCTAHSYIAPAPVCVRLSCFGTRPHSRCFRPKASQFPTNVGTIPSPKSASSTHNADHAASCTIVRPRHNACRLAVGLPLRQPQVSRCTLVAARHLVRLMPYAAILAPAPPMT